MIYNNINQSSALTIQPFQQQRSSSGLNLTWENLNVVFDKSSFPFNLFNKNHPKKHIIKNQYGHLASGELVGLLGSSGSGKTTLLNALSFRKVRNLTVNGSIKVNGIEMDREKMLSISSYVQQEDLFIGTLTVKEHLMFHAMLRVDASLTKEEKENKVNQLIHELMLTKCQDSLIGIPGKLKGISGGEIKRLSLATEVLNDPMLLFCDEPTSGLDSAMAYSVVDSLKKIANTGKTVVTTIHQPSSDLFLMFDYIYVLYDGNLALAGKRDEILNFLKQLNFICPTRYNPADFILDKLSLKPNTIQNDMIRSKQIVQSYQQSPLYQSLLNRIKFSSFSRNNADTFLYDHIKHRNRSRAAFFSEVFYIFKRNAINFFRDKGFLFMKVIQIVIFSALVGLTFLQQDLTQPQVDVTNKAILMSILCISLVGSLSSSVLYPYEFPTLCKENESRVYSVLSYFVSNILFEIPINGFLTLIFQSINYWLVGMNSSASNFFISYAWMFLVCLNGLSYGHMISAVTSNSLATIVVTVPGLMFQFVMNEFFLAGAGSPLDWLKYIGWIYYSFNLLMLNQWRSIDSISGSAATPKNGQDILDSFQIKYSDLYGFAIGIVGLIFVWRAIAFLVTYIRVKYF